MKKKIIAILFVSFCAYAIWYGFYQTDQLVKRRILVSGVVEEVSYTSKSVDYFVTYHFNLNGKATVAKASLPYVKFEDVHFLDSLLKGKEFPVIYQIDNPDNSRMLLTRHEYEKYDIQIPSNVNYLIKQIDSLRYKAH